MDDADARISVNHLNHVHPERDCPFPFITFWTNHSCEFPPARALRVRLLSRRGAYDPNRKSNRRCKERKNHLYRRTPLCVDARAPAAPDWLGIVSRQLPRLSTTGGHLEPAIAFPRLSLVKAL